MVKNNIDSICVVGLGYIGIPTSVFFAKNDVDVLAYDINPTIVEKINSGELPIAEPVLADLLKEVVSNKKLKAYNSMQKADAFIIAVPTPLDEQKEPDISCIKKAVETISTVIEKGNIVVLESTSPVGTTELLARELQNLRPDLKIIGEDNVDVFVAYCPERMIPGNIFELVENERIIGGINKESAQKAQDLYSLIVKGNIIVTDSKTAEMSKLAENSFRDVNIAFANELSIICDKLGIDVYNLIELANHHPRVNILQPRCGVGGHCIAVDPWFIVSQNPDESRLIRTAREVNDSKCDFVLKKIDSIIRDLQEETPSITCFGLSYKANIDDLRESPALAICQKLAAKYENVFAVEPYLNEIPTSLKNSQINLVDINTGLKSDILLFLVDHELFKQIKPKLKDSKKVVDLCGIWRYEK